MNDKLGRQYPPDNAFKKAARLHQSRYRAEVMRVECDVYGSKLQDADARRLLNYYDGLDVRDWYRRELTYSRKRDGDLLRSEHIPVNMFVPLIGRDELAKRLIESAFGIACAAIKKITVEYEPRVCEANHKGKYLDDRTAFDVYVEYTDQLGKTSGIGIEVKYTEGAYPIGEKEQRDVENGNSLYWTVTGKSGLFLNATNPKLKTDPMRQIWRNHLLGLAMQQHEKIESFTSIILFPDGNEHFHRVIQDYQSLLIESHRSQVRGCTYEKFIASITGDEDILKWKSYLEKRYLVTPVSQYTDESDLAAKLNGKTWE